MKTYNRSLDFVALAMDSFAKGRVKTAAKFFQEAVAASDAQRAIAIIEASNTQAFTARVEAKAKAPVKAKVVSPELKALAALGADPDELGIEPEGEPEEVEDEAVEEENEEDSAEFAKALATLTRAAK
jgi:hypothetical protein